MTDLLGRPFEVGDVVIYAGGNARYGGLKLIVGVVTKMTAARLKVLTTSLKPDDKKSKLVTTSGSKMLLCYDAEVLQSEAVRELKETILSE